MGQKKGGKKNKAHNSRKSAKGKGLNGNITKSARRAAFANRHIDLVYDDVRADAAALPARGVDAFAALPRTARQPQDEDLPAGGQIYCVETARYFINEQALAAHKKTKGYKRRCKELRGQRPHGQADAETAAGKGPADNGNVRTSGTSYAGGATSYDDKHTQGIVEHTGGR